MSKVLITGGTGTVGSYLSQLLQESGYQVVHLTRKISGKERFASFIWDVSKGQIDKAAFSAVNHIIHLAGAGVADAKWTEKRKNEIIDSRIKSTELLFDYVKKLDLKLDSYTSASAIGIYADAGDKWVEEDSKSGKSFLAEVVKKWEHAADIFENITTVSKIRIGIVLSEKGGALTEMAKPIRIFAGAPLGSGHQYMSWIHLHDLAMIFKFVVENGLGGIFNAVAPNPVTNRALTRSIAKTLRRPLLLPNVPNFAMKLILGEMATMVLEGARVSSNKIQTAGYKFRYENVDAAVKDLLG
ncbi:MAG: hypothetical protein ACJA08_001351 [Cyclobacteriaceae bacterium]|jgi:uncharacterized protein (TIGR01777 family)